MSASTRARHALVVEDDAAIRALVAHILRRENFTVEEAVNGREAAASLLGGGWYDLIVLDLAMPEMTGMELLEQLRSAAPRLLSHIIVVTAALHHLRQGLPAGVCRVVAKPFEVGELVTAVRACSAAHRSEPAEIPLQA